MAVQFIPIVLGAARTVYNISRPLYNRYKSQLTKASKEAVDKAKDIKKLGSNQLIKKLGGEQTTKASLSQKGVKKVVTKGAAGVAAGAGVTGYLLGKDKKEDKKKSKLAVKPGRKPKRSKLAVKPGRKPPPPLPKAKEVKPRSKPPEGMKNPMTMKSGTKKYANGGNVRKPKGMLN
jgi:NADH dehydrogenase/NADH:ubiquinone oxidoreductase subunit G